MRVAHGDSAGLADVIRARLAVKCAAFAGRQREQMDGHRKRRPHLRPWFGCERCGYAAFSKAIDFHGERDDMDPAASIADDDVGNACWVNTEDLMNRHR